MSTTHERADDEERRAQGGHAPIVNEYEHVTRGTCSVMSPSTAPSGPGQGTLRRYALNWVLMRVAWPAVKPFMQRSSERSM